MDTKLVISYRSRKPSVKKKTQHSTRRRPVERVTLFVCRTCACKQAGRACNHKYAYDLMAYSGEYSHVCIPVPYSRKCICPSRQFRRLDIWDILRKERERLSGRASVTTHWFPVVEGLVAVGDVAEQSGTESSREETFECGGTFRSPNLSSTTD